MGFSQFVPFKKVAVIGSGVMGSAIAAHLANARIPCLLLDMVPKSAGTDRASRNQLAINGLKKALAAKPAAFFLPQDAALVQVGNLEDDIATLATCDWVIEVVVEDLQVKQSLFAKIEPHLAPETIVSSNTSGLSIEKMLEGRSQHFAEHFCVTHFFNPVRYLHLLEVVKGPRTKANVVKRLAWFGKEVLGKGVVYGKDTPNFVANRIGVFGMMETMRVMQAEGYTVEEVDAVFGSATGRPKSAVFRTADVVGLDTFIHVAQNCFDNLPNDESRQVFQIPDFLRKMVQNGWLGQKSGSGFYRKVGSEIEVLDIATLTYHAKQKVRADSLGAIRHMENLADKIAYMVSADDRMGQLAWRVLSATCVYAANRVGEIADDLVQIDNAMKWGFGWEMGPFETWDAMGVPETVKRLKAEDRKVPDFVLRMLSMGRNSFYETDAKGNTTVWNALKNEAEPVVQDHKVMSFAKATSRDSALRIVKETMATRLIDLGDGVLACEFITKMNAIDGEVIAGINEGLDLCEKGDFNALVLANDGKNFSVGANLLLLYMAAQQGEWVQVERLVRAFQDVGRRLCYSKVPTVAAPFQLTLGGGAEVSLWCNRIRAHAELYMGLVEVGVGLIPGGGGTVQMLKRSIAGMVDDPMSVAEPFIKRALETVAMAKVSTSAEEACQLQYMLPSDGVTMNRDYLLYSAKQEALGMVRAGFRAPRETTYKLPGKSAYATFEMALRSLYDGHRISEYDLHISLKVAHVMTGGNCTPRQPVTEQYMLDLEREAFLSLCGEVKTQERIMYMLQNNKPLRN